MRLVVLDGNRQRLLQLATQRYDYLNGFAFLLDRGRSKRDTMNRFVSLFSAVTGRTITYKQLKIDASNDAEIGIEGNEVPYLSGSTGRGNQHRKFMLVERNGKQEIIEVHIAKFTMTSLQPM